MASSLHRTNVYVPAGVAALLKTYPALIAPAVHAFCQRDASQLQVTILGGAIATAPQHKAPHRATGAAATAAMEAALLPPYREQLCASASTDGVPDQMHH